MPRPSHSAIRPGSWIDPSSSMRFYARQSPRLTPIHRIARLWEGQRPLRIGPTECQRLQSRSSGRSRGRHERCRGLLQWPLVRQAGLSLPEDLGGQQGLTVPRDRQVRQARVHLCRPWDRGCPNCRRQEEGREEEQELHVAWSSLLFFLEVGEVDGEGNLCHRRHRPYLQSGGAVRVDRPHLVFEVRTEETRLCADQPLLPALGLVADGPLAIPEVVLTRDPIALAQVNDLNRPGFSGDSFS